MIGGGVLGVVACSPLVIAQCLEQSPLPYLLEHQHTVGSGHRLGPPPPELVPGVALVGDVEADASLDQSPVIGLVERDDVEEYVGVATAGRIGLEDPHDAERQVVVSDREDVGLHFEAKATAKDVSILASELGLSVQRAREEALALVGHDVVDHGGEPGFLVGLAEERVVVAERGSGGRVEWDVAGRGCFLLPLRFFVRNGELLESGLGRVQVGVVERFEASDLAAFAGCDERAAVVGGPTGLLFDGLPASPETRGRSPGQCLADEHRRWQVGEVLENPHVARTIEGSVHQLTVICDLEVAAEQVVHRVDRALVHGVSECEDEPCGVMERRVFALCDRGVVERIGGALEVVDGELVDLAELELLHDLQGQPGGSVRRVDAEQADNAVVGNHRSLDIAEAQQRGGEFSRHHGVAMDHRPVEQRCLEVGGDHLGEQIE